MTSRLSIGTLIVFGAVLPLAVLLGYMLAVPLDRVNFLFIGVVFALLAFPAVIKWHHAILIVSVNATMNAFFLPGSFSLWMALAWISLGLCVVNSAMGSGRRLNPFTEAGWPLLVLAGVVLVTIKLTGGIGGQAAGGDRWGGKSYIAVLSAVAAFFAISSIRIPPRLSEKYVSLYFLSGLTGVASNIVVALGPSFYFMFYFFSTDAATRIEDQGELTRYVGLSFSAMSVAYFMLMRFGINGIFNLNKPWRIVLFLGAFILGLLGGFRSNVITLVLLFAVQFLLEGLHRTKAVAFVAIIGVLAGAVLIGTADRLPLSVQRSLSFLPLDIDPAAKRDAASTIEWRVDMWKVVVRDVPKYLFLGKGYVFSGRDLELTTMAVQRGLYSAFEDTLVTGNYHQGFLTLIIPFGIWGFLAFAWFALVGFKILYRNYRWGDPRFKNINIFLLNIYTVRMFFYWFLYGQFDLDLIAFVSFVALSIAVNGPQSSRFPAASQKSPLSATTKEPEPQPA
ncbi:hypothetical protein GC207_01270 [bacterium]|nr:hypothetical protein [bacterium]